MKLSTMQDWLTYIGSVHQQPIDLGLDRVRAVAERLNILETGATVIVVGGTNGKGSTVAALNAIYRAAGYRVGVFTSPFMFKHNEEVMINDVLAEDAAFCVAFEAIEAVRGEVTLTPFEYHTLAALCIFKQHPLDVWVLEVGMGGRLDAVNIMDADLAIITSIALDHQAWLGNTRETIAFEKAGILRHGRPAVIAELEPPLSLLAAVEAVGSVAAYVGKDYKIEKTNKAWSFISNVIIKDIQDTQLYPNNLAAAVKAVLLLEAKRPVSEAQIRQGLARAVLPGRQQCIKGEVTHILDVAHNPHATALLCERLNAKDEAGETIAVFSMLSDKDIVASLQCVSGAIDHWCVAPLESDRGASAQQLKTAFDLAGITAVDFSETMSAAYAAAKKRAVVGDRIVVFGSFVTVAAVMRLMQP